MTTAEFTTAKNKTGYNSGVMAALAGDHPNRRAKTAAGRVSDHGASPAVIPAAVPVHRPRRQMPIISVTTIAPATTGATLKSTAAK